MKRPNRMFFATISLLLLTAASAVFSQTDLSMREALYFTGSKTTHIDVKNDRYVVRGGTMQLKTTNGSNCAGGFCEFNIGFIAFRAGTGEGVLSSYGLLQVDSGGLVGNTIYFGPDEKVKEGILPLKLKSGMNKVTFTIDPYKKTAETNERNNTITVSFIVARAGKP
jgi:hypothetical protein